MGAWLYLVEYKMGSTQERITSLIVSLECHRGFAASVHAQLQSTWETDFKDFLQQVFSVANKSIAGDHSAILDGLD